MSVKQFNWTNLQIGIAGLLVIIAPVAMTLTPYEGIFTDGVWKAQFHADPLNSLRAGMILVGLALACTSCLLLVRELVKASNEVLRISLVQSLLSKTSMAFCSMTIGWAALPYWVNGVFQAFSGNSQIAQKNPILDFDPAALMPEIWIGEVWRLGVMLIALVIVCISPILFLVNLGVCIKSKHWKQGIATSAWLAMSVAFFIWSPNYWGWIVD